MSLLYIHHLLINYLNILKIHLDLFIIVLVSLCVFSLVVSLSVTIDTHSLLHTTWNEA